MLGDEAVAQGALDAGISGVYAYPGTPSTEIMEYVQQSTLAAARNVHRVWSANEKTAMEAALGMSYAGKRALVCFKHVGLNVAADAFVNSAITGVNGGIVVVACDDPSMHSSQNEQDSRFYAKFAMVPALEPSNQQEAYEMVQEAFDLSEQFNMPVVLRLTTRLAHSRAGVELAERAKDPKELRLPGDPKQYVLLPAIAKRNYTVLLGHQEGILAAAEQARHSALTLGAKGGLGIITTGIAYNYLMEALHFELGDRSLLKITQYPTPRKLVQQLYAHCGRLLVLEEGMPFVEGELRGLLALEKPVHGRMDNTVPRIGELSPGAVAKALGLELPQGHSIPDFVVGRPPALCIGCGHRDVYNALNAALAPYGPGHVFGDIGCYTLGALPPFNAINSCVDMGASITMAKGAYDAGLRPAVAVIGDSTFTHSGMTGLLDAVIEHAGITVIISDNSTTGMTGGQTSSATGRLINICTGLGVAPEHIRVIEPLRKNHEANVKVIEEELAYQGVSVIIPQRECIQTFQRRMLKQRAEKQHEA